MDSEVTTQAPPVDGQTHELSQPSAITPPDPSLSFGLAYKEEHVWPLTSRTNCYTGASAVVVVDGSDMTEGNFLTGAIYDTLRRTTSIRWATESHICCMETPNGWFPFNTGRTMTLQESVSDAGYITGWRTPRRSLFTVESTLASQALPGVSSDDWLCVGHSAASSTELPRGIDADTVDEPSEHAPTSGVWQCWALLLQSSLPSANQPSARHTHAPHPTSSPALAWQQQQQQSQSQTLADNEEGTVATAVSQNHRRSSSVSVSEMPTASVTMDQSFTSHHAGTAIPLNYSTDLDDNAARHPHAQQQQSSASQSHFDGAASEDPVRLVVELPSGNFVHTPVATRPLALKLCPVSVQDASTQNLSPSDHPFESTGSFPIDTDGITHENERSEAVVAMVWFGSADHNKLECFAVCETEHDHELSRIVLDGHPAFTFLSPVMAIDWLILNHKDYDREENSNTRKTASSRSDIGTNRQCLVVACQDGTIRLILFSCQGKNQRIVDVRSDQVIVDGPICCLQIEQLLPQPFNLRNDTRLARLHVTAGSLCGHVLTLELNADLTELQDTMMEFEGPYMVVAGLWDARLVTEDSVTAVYHCSLPSMDNGRCCSVVVVGTHSGRCLLYSQQCMPMERSAKDTTLLSDDDWLLRWNCHLSQPVTGILGLCVDRSSADASVCRPGWLFVTTRRSLHLFRVTNHRNNATVKAASLTKGKLDDLWNKLNQKQRQDDIVRDVVESDFNEVPEKQCMSSPK